MAGTESVSKFSSFLNFAKKPIGEQFLLKAKSCRISYIPYLSGYKTGFLSL